jgi:hypothetical protein
MEHSFNFTKWNRLVRCRCLNELPRMSADWPCKINKSTAKSLFGRISRRCRQLKEVYWLSSSRPYLPRILKTSRYCSNVCVFGKSTPNNKSRTVSMRNRHSSIKKKATMSWTDKSKTSNSKTKALSGTTSAKLSQNQLIL